MAETPPAKPGEPPADDVLAAGPGRGPDAPTADETLSEDDDLRTSLDPLSRLATGRMELADVLPGWRSTRWRRFPVRMAPD